MSENLYIVEFRYEPGSSPLRSRLVTADGLAKFPLLPSPGLQEPVMYYLQTELCSNAQTVSMDSSVRDDHRKARSLLPTPLYHHYYQKQLHTKQSRLLNNWQSQARAGLRLAYRPYGPNLHGDMKVFSQILHPLLFSFMNNCWTSLTSVKKMSASA